MDNRTSGRRRALGGIVAALAITVAGCSGGDDEAGTATHTSDATSSSTSSSMVVDPAAKPLTTDGTFFTEKASGNGFAIADEGDPCASVRQPLGCTDVVAAGGRFMVAVERSSSKVVTTIYAERSGRAVPVLATEPTTVGSPEDGAAEYYGITAGQGRVGDVGIAVVTFLPSSATAPPPQIDLVTWEDGDDAPSVAAHISGERSARFRIDDATIVVTEPDYTDGSPGCCPKRRTTRLIRRIGPSMWTESVTTEPHDYQADEPFPALDTRDPEAVAHEVYEAWRHHDRERGLRGATDEALAAMLEDPFPGVPNEPQCQSDDGITCAFQYEGGAVVMELARIEGGTLRVTSVGAIAD
jgi:hypothetical protein